MSNFEIWKTNQFNDDILTECVGVLYDLQIAKDFVDYKATVGEGFVVKQNGKIVYDAN